ncbi:MAG: HEAT repeat domain-containing protein [Planctomycetaceae bacterium]
MKEVEYCCADPCEIAKLIYQSQTACYADDREKAIDDLGDYSCQCNPEIMVAFVYALNDADEEVRAEAADEIGDQLRDRPCCCSKEVVAALTCALADCDDDVVSEAEEALEACGYEIVDGCCNTCCGTGAAPTVTPAPAEGGAAPAPAPPEDPKAYFPSRLRQQQTKAKSDRPNRLASLFGMRN